MALEQGKAAIRRAARVFWEFPNVVANEVRDSRCGVGSEELAPLDAFRVKDVPRVHRQLFTDAEPKRPPT